MHHNVAYAIQVQVQVQVQVLVQVQALKKNHKVSTKGRLRDSWRVFTWEWKLLARNFHYPILPQ